MDVQPARIVREKKTIDAMIRMYCHDLHFTDAGLCAECQELNTYARTRLDKCPFQGSKPVCADCPVHCYQADMRERMRTVMRYAGPRMIFRHPVMAIQHLLDEHRKPSLRS